MISSFYQLCQIKRVFHNLKIKQLNTIISLDIEKPTHNIKLHFISFKFFLFLKVSFELISNTLCNSKIIICVISWR
jgi:hypothetical protein